MVPEQLCLRKNVAPWDRALRLAVVAAIVLGLPLAVRDPFALLLGGAVCGFQLVAALLGY